MRRNNRQGRPFPFPTYGGKYSENPRNYDELMEMIDTNSIQDEKVPKIDLVTEFDPDSERVKNDPLWAALSIGMQQMPGGIKGMQRVMMQFMKATETKNWDDEEINIKEIENMMFDPNARTISRIISLMEARYEEVEEVEEELLAERMKEMKKEARRKMIEQLEKEEREEREKEKEEEREREKQNKKEDLEIYCEDEEITKKEDPEIYCEDEITKREDPEIYS